MKPTIGRRLWFWHNDVVFPEQTPVTSYEVPPGGEQQPFDAGVVYVHPDGRVNLSVTDHMGKTFVAVGIQIIDLETRLHVVQRDGKDVLESVENETPPLGTPWAQWMPYQVNKAKEEGTVQ